VPKVQFWHNERDILARGAAQKSLFFSKTPDFRGFFFLAHSKLKVVS
jgi:hypothetical protein